jgi:hypothetical protein
MLRGCAANAAPVGQSHGNEVRAEMLEQRTWTQAEARNTQSGADLQESSERFAEQ